MVTMRIPTWKTRPNVIQGSRSKEFGIVSVEFALMFPIFLLLLFGAYELGIYLHDKQVVTNAVREAARFGIVMKNPRPTQAQIQQKVLDWSTTLIGSTIDCVTPGGACKDVQVANSAGNPGTALTVKITTLFQFKFLSQFSGFLPQISLAAQSIMVLE